MRMLCRDFTNFVPEGTIFKGAVDKFVLGKDWTKSAK